MYINNVILMCINNNVLLLMANVCINSNNINVINER